MGYGIVGRGDYGVYRGDPGLFGFLGKLGKGLIRRVVGMTPVGAAAEAVLGATRYATTRRRPPPPPPPSYPGMNLQYQPPQRGARGLGGLTGLGVKRRRMNVANPKALRKAIRRTAGFVKLAKRSLKGTGYRIVSSGSRSRRDVPAGHVHVR